MTTMPASPAAPIQFCVRKGKWVFRCMVESDPRDLFHRRNYDFVPQLESGDIQVTKRVSLAELQGIVAESVAEIPEFYIASTTDASAEHATGFAQFRHYLFSRNRAGVASLSPQYWLIFLPDDIDSRLKCLVVERSAISQPPEQPLRTTTPPVPTTAASMHAADLSELGKSASVEVKGTASLQSSSGSAEETVSTTQTPGKSSSEKGGIGASSWNDFIRIHRTFHAAQYLIHASGPLETAATSSMNAKRVKHR
ncbi:hypothetical protein H310_00865 [Aphanomyces invadans]|uniref:Uncharacterized protein n=1 Tax=Aphanomyces invadans TaxID=157072 RepID=A0A024UQU0_9STRA|nr:hypothetical protein H310_00865 [Aphanomyces invadans]ETW08222.1 hypothetical protein H310_00865 [Aphanomyces invadans]|eukprot:XP_008862027.1 hypothetical protein H310_00865 [Aphanomyces invadans]